MSRGWRLWLPGILGVYVGLAAAQDWAQPGAQLYHGQRPVPGRIVGSKDLLPTVASRCVNCHRLASRVDLSPADARSEADFGPVLTRAFLTEPRRRRGGPASAYELSSFCKLLQTGVDPAYIVITRAMPRFDVSQADCEALWNFLMQRQP